MAPAAATMPVTVLPRMKLAFLPADPVDDDGDEEVMSTECSLGITCFGQVNWKAVAMVDRFSNSAKPTHP